MNNEPDENLLLSINRILHHIAAVFLALSYVLEKSERLLEITLKFRNDSFQNIDDTEESLSKKLQEKLNLLISQNQSTSRTDSLNSLDGNSENHIKKYADSLYQANEMDSLDTATAVRFQIAMRIIDDKIKSTNSVVASDIYTIAYDLAIATLLKDILRAKESLFFSEKEIRDFRDRITKEHFSNRHNPDE